MPKASNKSARPRNSRNSSKRASRGSQSLAGPILSSKTGQLIAISQARREDLRPNAAALTHLLLRNFQLTSGFQQKRIRPTLESAALSSNQQLFGEVGAAIVDEIRQPLELILCNLSAAGDLLRLESSELREILADVRADTLRACETVADMRDLFAGKITRKAPIQINVIVDHLLKTLSIEARQHRISLMADLAPDLPKICADASQIEQAITNLIRNGIDAVTDAHPRERSLIIAPRHLPSDFVEISVTDTGDGISPNVFPRIFETYFTTKRDRMGLGLA